MDIEVIIAVILFIIVPIIFVERLHERIIIDVEKSKITRNIFGIIILLGMVLFFIDIISLKLFCLCFIPLYHFYSFRIMYNFFVKKMNRPPKDVTFDYTSKLFYDRAFAILFIIIAIIPFTLITGIFH